MEGGGSRSDSPSPKHRVPRGHVWGLPVMHPVLEHSPVGSGAGQHAQEACPVPAGTEAGSGCMDKRGQSH